MIFKRWKKERAKFLYLGKKKIFLGGLLQLSSISQIPKEVDLFICLDKNFYQFLIQGTYYPPQIRLWHISDGETDERLVKWCIKKIDTGLTIGFGCLGGHGRTGWLAARLVMHYLNLDGPAAVQYVRRNYSESAVETRSQLHDLGCIQPGELEVAKKWNSMSPEERICSPLLCYLSEEILESDWEKLPPAVQDYIILLLSTVGEKI